VKRRLITDEPGVTEGIAEPSLSMDSPGGFMVSNLVCGAVGAGFDGASDEGVGVSDKDLDADRRASTRRWGDEVLGRLVEKEWCALDLEADNAIEAPQLGGAEGSVVPAAGLTRVLDRQHERDPDRHAAQLRMRAAKSDEPEACMRQPLPIRQRDTRVPQPQVNFARAASGDEFDGSTLDREVVGHPS
jgi:hypothetical protein